MSNNVVTLPAVGTCDQARTRCSRLDERLVGLHRRRTPRHRRAERHPGRRLHHQRVERRHPAARTPPRRGCPAAVAVRRIMPTFAGVVIPSRTSTGDGGVRARPARRRAVASAAPRRRRARPGPACRYPPAPSPGRRLPRCTGTPRASAARSDLGDRPARRPVGQDRPCRRRGSGRAGPPARVSARTRSGTGPSARSPACHPPRQSPSTRARASPSGRSRSVRGRILSRIGVMADRLSALDASFLYLEEPFCAHARRECGDPAAAPGRRARLRARCGADPASAAIPAALPAVRPLGSRSPRQAGVGRRRRLRHQLPRATVGVTGAGCDDSCSTGRPAAGPPLDRDRPLWELLPGGGVGGRPGGAGDEDAPIVGRRHRHARPGSVDPGHRTSRTPSSPNPSPSEDATWYRVGVPCPARAGRVCCSTRWPTPSSAPVRWSTTCADAAKDVDQHGQRVFDAVGGVATTVRSLVRSVPRGPCTPRVSGGRVFAGVSADLDELRAIGGATAARSTTSCSRW